MSVRCYALDPESQVAGTYLSDRGEPEYVDRIRDALTRLKRVQDEVASQRWAGQFEVKVYAHVPCLYALGIDLNVVGSDGSPAMMASPYLFGVGRAETPVMQFSRATNPVLFDRYVSSIRAQTADARAA